MVTTDPRLAAIYVRVSTAKQDDAGTSLETQEAACRAYCEKRGYDIAGVYREVFSGTELVRRPALTAARQAIRSGAADLLLCYAVDRLGRKQAHVAIVAEEAEQAGARLEFVTEDFERSAVGEFIRSAKAFAAEVEREKIIERTQRGVRARAEAGMPLPGWKPPYGYRWADPSKVRLVDDHAQSEVVRRIYREALAGAPLRRIAAGLTADGIPSPTGRPRWGATTVHHILSTPLYAGEAFAFRNRVEKIPGGGYRRALRPECEQVGVPAGTVPALVDVIAFASVHARLARNKVESPRRNGTPEATLLRSGIAKCGYCNCNHMVYRTKTGPAYRCNGAGRGRGCPYHSIKADALDSAVWARVVAVHVHPDIVARELERLRQGGPAVPDLLTLDRRHAGIERQRQRVARAVASLDDDEAAAPLLAQLKALAAQERELAAERAVVDTMRADWEADHARLASVSEWCGRVAENLPTLTYGEKRDALVALGVGIKVFRADHLPRYEISLAIDDIVSSTERGAGTWRARRTPRR